MPTTLVRTEWNYTLLACSAVLVAAVGAGLLIIVRSLARALGAEPADLSIAAQKAPAEI